MATSILYNNQKTSIPGVYAMIKSGINNPPVAETFGNCLIIDVGNGDTSTTGFYGGGAGIAGTLASAKNAIYNFTSARDFQSFVNGGLYWLLGANVFQPGGGAQFGASQLTYIRAAQTVPATIGFTFVGNNGISGDTNSGGTITVQVRDEGYVGNGVLGDETRATSTITISNVGTAGSSSVTVKIGTLTVASYSTVIGDNIAAVVTGLVASAASIGLVTVSSSNATQLVIQAIRGKGTTANGVTPTLTVTGSAAGTATAFSGGITGTILTRGYAAKMIAGVSNTSAFILQFWRGTFKGLDSNISNGDPFDFVSELNTTAQLMAQSPEFTNMSTLVSWMQNSGTFNSYFNMSASNIPGDGIISATDLATYSSYNVASGGTQTYSNAYLNTVLDNISDQQYDFILSGDFGANARSTNNLTILSWINTAKVQPDLYIGGGLDSGAWSGTSTSSNNVAIAYNSQYVKVVHGGCKMTAQNATSFKTYASIYKASLLVGRNAGIQPQIPLTFKGISIDGETHTLTDKEANFGIGNGVLMTRPLGNAFACIRDINTLQANTFLVNSDGSTYSGQLRRIVRQLNKELITNLTTLLQKPDGSNRHTLSEQVVVSFVQGYLNSRVATDTQDNLIISYKNVAVKTVQDILYVTYSVVGNTEISFIISSGFLIDPNNA